MKKKQWGKDVWLLFHTLAHKIKDEYNKKIRDDLCEEDKEYVII